MASHLPIIKTAVAGSERMAPVDLRILLDNASQPFSGMPSVRDLKLTRSVGSLSAIDFAQARFLTAPNAAQPNANPMAKDAGSRVAVM